MALCHQTRIRTKHTDILVKIVVWLFARITWKAAHTSRVTIAHMFTHFMVIHMSRPQIVGNETSRIVPMNHFNAFFTYHTISSIPAKMINDHLNITAEQASNEMLSKIFKEVQVVDSNDGPWSQHDLPQWKNKIWNRSPILDNRCTMTCPLLWYLYTY